MGKKVTNSGHYSPDGYGVMRSRYFSGIMPDPQEEGTFITPLITGDIDDIKTGGHVTYTIPTDGIPSGGFRLTGLLHNVRIENNKTKSGEKTTVIYVVDNHHLANHAWREAIDMGYLDRGAIVLHIDRHFDNGKPEGCPSRSNETVAENAEYLTHHVEIGSFITPALATGMLSALYAYEYFPWNNRPIDANFELFKMQSTEEAVCVCNSEKSDDECYKDKLTYDKKYTIASLSHMLPRKKIILDIDLDAFLVNKEIQPEEEQYGWDILEKRANELALLAVNYAAVVTIATSPGFTNQSNAVRMAKLIVAAVQNRLDSGDT